MCKDVLKWFLRAFAVVAALTVISCADSPDEDDVVIPQCSISVDGTTIDKGSAAIMTFDYSGGTKQFSIQTTGEWEITGHESAPQNFALTTSKGEEKYTGKGDETFTVTLGEATTAKEFSLIVKVYASIFGQKKEAGTRTIKIMQIKGGVMPEGKVIYFNNFDKEKATNTHGESGNRWPFLDQFEGWKNQEGEGAAEVDYDFKSVSARTSGKLSDNSEYSNYAGSGSNNLLFGNGGYFTIQKIAVSKTDLQLTFGTERYASGESDNTFKNEEFLVTLSADGQSWSAPIDYTFEEGVDTNGKWNLAKADFTLPDETTTLYIKFATTIASAHRIDDVKLTDGIGGPAISFDGGGDTPPTPPTPPESGTITMSAADIVANGTTAITEGGYGSQNVDDVSTYYTWTMNDVTFAGARICKAKAGENIDSLYAGLIQMQGNASDKAKQGFFGNTVDLKKINKVVIVSKNTKYAPTEHLYVGTSAYPLGQNAVTRADLKQEGQTYTETFNISGDYGYFALANDKQGAFYVESVTVYYGGEGGGDEPTPSTPVTMTVAELVAKCKAAGTTETILDAANDVVVEAVVVTDKDGGNTKTNNLAIMAEGATDAGNGILLFGSGSLTNPADESYTWKSGDKVKVTLKAGLAKVCIYKGLYEIKSDKGVVDWIAIEKIGTATVTPVELTTVDNLADYQSMVVTVKDATSPATAAEWCTADAYKTHTFTVGGSNLTVYVQKNAAAFVGKPFKASATGDITGVVMVYQNAAQLAPRTADDVKAFNGEGGGDEPTPPTPAEGGVATYTPSEMGYENGVAVPEVSLNGGAVTLVFDKGTNSNPPKYYTSGTAVRCYGGNTITVRSDAKISKIEITRSSSSGTLTANVGTFSNETFTWTGENSETEVVLTVDGTTQFRIGSMKITYGEGGGGDQPDQPDQPVVGNTASLTLDDIAKSGPRSYKEFSITAADGSIWTGYCSGSADRLQMGWNTDTTKDASKSYVLVPDADKVINKITFTPEGGTTNNRVLALLPVDFTYTGQSADEVKKAAYAYSANTVKGSTEPLSIDLTGKNLKRFMIRAVGGAVYLTNITIEYAE